MIWLLLMPHSVTVLPLSLTHSGQATERILSNLYRLTAATPTRATIDTCGFTSREAGRAGLSGGRGRGSERTRNKSPCSSVVLSFGQSLRRWTNDTTTLGKKTRRTQIRVPVSVLFHRWASVYDAGPAKKKHWASVSSLLRAAGRAAEGQSLSDILPCKCKQR